MKCNTQAAPVVLILDFGSQYSWMIAKTLKELRFHHQGMPLEWKIEPFSYPIKKLKALKPKGIILSGGPASLLKSHAPRISVKTLLEIAPVMGICYGFQSICHQLGGKVEGGRSAKPRFGRETLKWEKGNGLKKTGTSTVWMSYGDSVTKIPKLFSVWGRITGASDRPARGGHAKAPAIIFSRAFKKPILAVSFHPEVAHSVCGKSVFTYFAKQMCQLKGPAPAPKNHWKTELTKIQNHIREEMNNVTGNVLCALSGGVDSTVLACLLTKTLGPSRVQCVFLDNGLLRQNEFSSVLKNYKQLKLNVEGIDLTNTFLQALKNISSPEQKRKIIGKVFIDAFRSYVKTQAKKKLTVLAQGTIYPDLIESKPVSGPSDVIKSHHNVGGLPRNIPFKKLLEPLKFYFKDEIRALGGALKIPSGFLERKPFPGPGLAVRICAPVNRENLKVLKQADLIFMEELQKSPFYSSVWQAFCVLLPPTSVGVGGDKRTLNHVVALRAVTSTDGMTADWFSFPKAFLDRLASRITCEVPKVNRVVLDMSTKPPSTIEWL